MNDLKTCTGCKRELPQTQYHHDRSKPDGLHTRCIDCKNRSARKARVNAPIPISQEAAARRDAILELIARHKLEFEDIYKERLRFLRRTTPTERKQMWLPANLIA